MKTTEETKYPVIKLIFRLLFGLGSLTSFVFLIYGAISWCNYIDLFKVSAINIQGISILTENDILQMADIGLDIHIQSLDPATIQARLEQNPYIKAAAVSKAYPNQVNILISERIPICYIHHKELFLVDAEGIVLPIPKQPLGSNPPVISGFDDDSLDYLPGYYVPNQKLRDIVEIVHATLISAPELYAEISEMHYWENGNFILYTVNSGTPIYLGNGNLPDQLSILANFQNRLNGRRNLSDYQYLDLRWNKQIVVKERRS
ncbi:MAG TPA: FtsQ-type POTRA domain-containing protein [Candidatus Marinimicrobia bacterium]|nr:FtsQ-type POTRA domain-containing protein [Candidatus Neomarinimicrobiota bacterium]